MNKISTMFILMFALLLSSFCYAKNSFLDGECTSSSYLKNEHTLDANRKLFGIFELSLVKEELRKLYSVKKDPACESEDSGCKGALYVSPEFWKEPTDVGYLVEQALDYASKNESDREQKRANWYSSDLHSLSNLKLIPGFIELVYERKEEIFDIYLSRADTFELSAFPGFIFKPAHKWVDRVDQYKNKKDRDDYLHVLYFAKPKTRFENYLRAKKIIEEYNLDMLAVPETEFFEMELEGVEGSVTMQVAIERKINGKFNFSSRTKRGLEELLQVAEQYDTLSPIAGCHVSGSEGHQTMCRNLVKQLTKFICLTECFDVTGGNFLWDNEKQKVFCIDTEELFNSKKGLEEDDCHPVYKGLNRLLYVSHSDFQGDIIKTASEILNLSQKEILDRIEKANPCTACIRDRSKDMEGFGE